MKNALKLKLAPIYILTVSLFSVICALSVIAVLIGGADKKTLFWFIPAIVVLCGGAMAAVCIIIKKLEKRFSDSEDKILSVFPKEAADALKTLGKNDIFPEKLLRWAAEQSQSLTEAQKDVAEADAELEMSGEIFWRVSDRRCVFRYGKWWEKRYGYTTLNTSSDIRDHIPPERAADLETAINSVRNGQHRNFNIVTSLMLSPQKTITVRIKGTGVAPTGNEAFKTVVGTIEDIDFESDMVNKLESELKKSRFLAENTRDVIYEVSVLENKMTLLNPDSENVLGIKDMDDFDGDRRPYWERIHPDYQEGYFDRFYDYNHIMLIPGNMLTYEYRVKNISGDFIWVRHKAQIISFKDGKVERVLGRISNINEAKGKELDLYYKSECDALTGSLLKTTLGEQYDTELKIGKKQAVVLLNINRFRFINNQYGYEFGDLVLRKFVAALWENQKGKCIVGRSNDDTFIIGMLAVDEKDHPESQIMKLVPLFSKPLKINNKVLNITFSASASVPSAQTHFKAAYEQAEKALKVCKSINQAYNNSFLMYDDETQKRYEEL